MHPSVVFSIFFALCSCKAPQNTVETGDSESKPIDSASGIPVNDQTETHPNPPQDGYQIATPVMMVQPYSEIIYCYYGTYDGPDVGVVHFLPFTHSSFNHHSILRTQFGVEAEDGELVACGDSMEDLYRDSPDGMGGRTLIQVTHVKGQTPLAGDWLALPDGYAVKLNSGSRWVVDTHFINPTDEIVLVNDTMNFGLVPVDEVENWIGAFELRGDVEIPPQEEWSNSFDCTWEEDYEILSIFAHMHHLGKRFATDWTHNGQTERIYELTEWLPEYRENPRDITQHYLPGEFLVQKVTCSLSPALGTIHRRKQCATQRRCAASTVL